MSNYIPDTPKKEKKHGKDILEFDIPTNEYTKTSVKDKVVRYKIAKD